MLLIRPKIWLYFIGFTFALSGPFTALASGALKVEVTAVTDGDSLRAGDLRLRLFGIDAPEIQQVCQSADGPVHVHTDQIFNTGETVSLGVRPEKIHLSKGASGALNEFAVTVEDYAYLGVATHYRVRTKAGTRLNVLQTSPPSGETPLSWGEAGFASISPKHIIPLTD